jgi:DNA-binding NtrC family response regulator
MDTFPATLLIHQNEKPLSYLRAELEALGVPTIRARACSDALHILKQDDPPECIFTDLTVADGTWTDVLALTARSPTPVALIVVSDVLDIPLYLAVMETGAFDFIVVPCARADLAYVVKRAGTTISERRRYSRAFAPGAAREAERCQRHTHKGDGGKSICAVKPVLDLVIT